MRVVAVGGWGGIAVLVRVADVAIGGHGKWIGRVGRGTEKRCCEREMEGVW